MEDGHCLVDLFVECRELENLDTRSKSDPVVCLFSVDKLSNSTQEVGRTETVPNNLNPKFSTALRVTYYFEKVQPLKFSVYDMDDPRKSLDHQDYLGSTEVVLAKILVAKDQTMQLPLVLKSGKAKGLLIVRAEEVNSGGTRGTLTLNCEARGLDNLDGGLFGGKSDPFLVFQRVREDGVGVQVAKTEVVNNDLNPKWRPIMLTAEQLSNNDLQRPVIIQCMDYDSDDKADLIGQVQTSISSMLQAPELVLWNKEKEAKMTKKKKKYEGSGKLVIRSCVFRQEFSFVDYLAAGMEISMMVAIDFSGSNGDPRLPQSLHYFWPDGQMNQYQAAISSVGDVLAPYDTDGLIPCYGFGMKVPPSTTVSHCHPLDLQCQGVAGVMQAYQNTLPHIILSGPTCFAPIIETCAKWAGQFVDKYVVLLIITDGEILDMDETKRVIVEVSQLPISVVVVGVGQADFSSMNELDGDNVRVSYMGRSASRDIVQFVAFRDFAGKHPSFLAENVCAELPTQFLEYARMRGLQPDALRAPRA